MLDIRGLTVGFGAGAPVLSGIDLAIERGSAVIVTAAAGAGKSTLLAVASGIIPKLIRPQQIEGSVALDGIDIAQWSSADLYRHVGIVLQAVEDQVWDLTVEDLIAFPLENRGVAQAEIRARVGAVIEQMGIAALIGRAVRTLSGGERRIAALASALVWQPSLLVLDEPTSGLDPHARGRMIQILRRLGGANLTLLIAEQDLAWFDGVADRVVFLAGGRVIDDRHWAQARYATEAFAAAGVEPPFAPMPARSPRPPERAGAALNVRGLTSALRQRDGQPVLQAIDLTVDNGEVVGVIGPNGAGKTTLMRSVLGLQRSTAGRIAIGGEGSADWTVAQRARRIGYVAQNIRRMFFLLSILDEVVFSLSGGETGAKVVAMHRDAAMELLARVRLADKADASPFALSAREQLMLALICIEAAQPALVILDEPLIACDSAWRADVAAFLDRCRARGRAVLLISHDLRLVDRAADRVLIIERGTVAFDGERPAAWASEAFARLGWPRPDRDVTPAAEARLALA
jgi:energy-coupling factor transport system ATP-binding protein